MSQRSQVVSCTCSAVISNLRSGNLAVLVQHTVQCVSLALAHAEKEAAGVGEDEGTAPGFFLLEALNGMRLTAAFVGKGWRFKQKGYEEGRCCALPMLFREILEKGTAEQLDP